MTSIYVVRVEVHFEGTANLFVFLDQLSAEKKFFALAQKQAAATDVILLETEVGDDAEDAPMLLCSTFENNGKKVMKVGGAEAARRAGATVG